MAGPVASDPTSDPITVSDAFAAARELLQRADDDAARTRADADRYLRQREQEAELLIAKARRLLAVAEVRAAAIGSQDAIEQDGIAEVVDSTPRPEPIRTVDLDAMAEPERPPSTPTRRAPSDLDRILADAISKAVDRSLTEE